MPQCGEDGSAVRVPSFLLGFKITSSIPCLTQRLRPHKGRGRCAFLEPQGLVPMALEAVWPYPSVSRVRFTGTPAPICGLTGSWAETGRLTDGVMLHLRWPDFELACQS